MGSSEPRQNPLVFDQDFGEAFMGMVSGATVKVNAPVLVRAVPTLANQPTAARALFFGNGAHAIQEVLIRRLAHDAKMVVRVVELCVLPFIVLPRNRFDARHVLLDRFDLEELFGM